MVDKNTKTYTGKEDLPMYSSNGGKGGEMIKGIETINRLSGLETFLNIGYADSFFEYWMLRPGISSKRLTLKLIEPILDQNIGYRNFNVLVVGAGRGGELALLNEVMSASVVGLEFSRRNVRAARELIRESNRDEEIGLVRGIAEELPFPDRSFSCVYSCESAFHFKDKKAFVREAHRVLKDGGSLIVGDITKRGEVSRDKVWDRYRKMLNAEEFFTREDYREVIGDTFGRDPDIEDLTDKNMKHLARGSDLLLSIFDHIEKFPPLKKKIKISLERRDIDLTTFLDNIRTAKISYERSMARYLRIRCTK